MTGAMDGCAARFHLAPTFLKKRCIASLGFPAKYIGFCDLCFVRVVSLQARHLTAAYTIIDRAFRCWELGEAAYLRIEREKLYPFTRLVVFFSRSPSITPIRSPPGYQHIKVESFATAIRQ